MENTANIVIYLNSDVIRNTYEGMSFACENTFSFVVPYTIIFAKLQYGFCESIESDILKRVSNILYQSSVVVFGSLVQIELMPIIDETSIQLMFHIHQLRTRAYKGVNNNSDEEFEATYEAGDEDEDDDGGGEAVAETLVVPPAVSQLMVVPLFMCSLDLDAMHALELGVASREIDERQFIIVIGVVDREDGEFRIGIEYGSRKSVSVAIRSYTISRGVDYVVYEFEPQTFYTKFKTYGYGCNWLIRASLIQKKACWEIRRYNGGTCVPWEPFHKITPSRSQI
ncbi:hypothetical protein Ahy_A07g032620 [Arachis hypogaea]|uniref:Transposase MuDR plant domain-containing protein n=1 Tax=Arachis hypogaea TaxID=3818 RepID=A0A445C7C6_ARAHY|nr:hypothetical protein Ahy_A07g032620 [Arachis hypogaea]